MTEQAQIQGRARARSNSLQRMLELEKKLLLERTQGVAPNAKSHQSSPAMSTDSLPTSPTPQQRRFELSPRKENRKPAPIPTRNYSAIPPPLVINTHPKGPGPIPRKQVGAGVAAPTETSTAAMAQDKPSSKTVAFMFPPEVEEQRSVCQSPSWEAYGRRKMEKKEEKRGRREERKKEKEQIIKDTKPRGRRLSKAPPPVAGIVPTLGNRSMSDPMVPVRQIQPKPRPSSVLGIPIPAKKEEPDKPKQKRSGSLTSAIRKSFEIRRASFDRDSGFVGGVKLKEKKEEFHQKVLEDQAKGNSKVHPALRKSFVGHGSFTPLKVQPGDKEEKKEPKRRAYPPISIQAATARNPSLLTPTSPPKPDFTNIYLWSARAGGGQPGDECAVYDSEDQTDEKDEKLPPVEQSQLSKERGGLTRSGGIYVKSSPPEGHLAKFSSRSQEFREMKRENKEQPSSTQAQPSPAMRQPLGSHPTHNEIHIAYTQKGAKKSVPGPKPRTRGGSFSSILSALSIPPEPPRKSSKRKSLILPSRFQPESSQDETSKAEDLLGSFRDPYTPPKLELKQLTESRPAEINRSPKIKTKSKEKMVQSSPPSIPYERTAAGARPKLYTSDSWATSNTKWNIKDTAKGVFRRRSSSVSSPLSATSPEKREESFPGHPKMEQTRQQSQSNVQFTKGHSTSASVPTINTAPSVLVPRTYSPMADSPSTWRPDTSSSEDGSYSDALHSVSPPSTPNTSPPMSETEQYPASVPTARKPRSNGYGYSTSAWSSDNSPQLLTSARFQPGSTKPAKDLDFDPIEEAARKVMEAFPDARIHRPSYDRGQADPKPLANSGSLPKLKHQALEPAKSRSRQMSMAPEPLSADHPPQSPMDFPPRAQKTAVCVPEIASKSSRRHPTSSLSTHPGEPIAKMFVECCACKYYHDMPSKLYEAMANPETVLTSTENLGSFMGTVSMTVRCPWCKHEMSTKCCAGFAAMVYIKERLH